MINYLRKTEDPRFSDELPKFDEYKYRAGYLDKEKLHKLKMERIKNKNVAPLSINIQIKPIILHYLIPRYLLDAPFNLVNLLQYIQIHNISLPEVLAAISLLQ